MQSYDISQQTGNSANELIIGYIGRFGEPLFAARDFVTVHVYEIYKMSSLHSWYKLVTYINSLYPNVKLSLVSISLCFRYKLKLSLIVYAFL